MIESVDFPEFVPHPLFRSGHLQTLGVILLPQLKDPGQGTCHIVELSDGDQIAVIEDEFPEWQEGDRIVVAMHGLTGSHASQYMIRIRNQMELAANKIFRIDMRGFGDSTFISKGHCSAGSYQDLGDVLAWILEQHPTSPITLVAFSLGANITLHYLGRDPDAVPRQVDSCFAVAPPIDLMHCSWNLRRGLNRIYDHSFIKSLHHQLRLRRQRVVDLKDRQVFPLPRRLLQFDDEYTSIICGYQGARDYYQQCSSAPVLKQIQVPTKLIVAMDDPVVPHSMFERCQLSSCIQLISTRYGGHLGYIGKPLAGKSRWLDQRLSEWIDQLPKGLTDHPTSSQGADSNPADLRQTHLKSGSNKLT